MSRPPARSRRSPPRAPPPRRLALRWVVDQPGVSTVIPGARSPEQARGNAEAALLAPLDESTLRSLEAVYDSRVRAHVHDRW
nr:aldo/keto reductase [Angustibacter aerolatus]